MCCREEQTTISVNDRGKGPKHLASFGRAGGYPTRKCECGQKVAFHWLAQHRATCEPYRRLGAEAS